MRITLYIFVLCLVTSFGSELTAQDKLKFGNTANTSGAPSNTKKDKSQRVKHKAFWIKNNSKGLLMGNPCMEEVVEELGFQYLIQIKGQNGYKNGPLRYFHNLGFKYSRFFTKGPFWKFKLKKKRKECRSLTRDMMG